MNFKFLCINSLAITFMINCSPETKNTTDKQGVENSTEQQTYQPASTTSQLNWLSNTTQATPSGMQQFDLASKQVLNQQGQTVSLLQLLNSLGKSKAIVQAIDVLSGGSLCGNCIAAAKELDEQVLATRSDTSHVLVLTSKQGTASQSFIQEARSRISSTNDLSIFLDIQGSFNQIGGNTFPTTLVINDNKQGRLLNMHQSHSYEVNALLDMMQP